MSLPYGDVVRVRVPATSANLGPAFDCAGLALTHHDVVDVTVAAAPCATTYPRVRSAVRMAMAAFTPAWPYTPVTVHHAEFTR